MRQQYLDMFKAAQLAVTHCEAKPDETIVVLTDSEKNPVIAEAFYTAGVASGAETILISMPTRAEILMDPPKAVIAALKDADLVFDAVTKAWIYAPSVTEILATGTRMLQILVPEASIIARPPNGNVVARAKRSKELLSQCKTLRISSDLGTDITFERGDRPAHAQDGVVNTPGEWDSISTGISAFAPIETKGDGVVFMQGTAFLPMDQHLIVDEPIRLDIEGGRIVHIETNHELARTVSEWLANWNDPNSYVVSHTGWGTDHRAKMLPPDPGGWESIMAAVNLAFGSNTIPQLKGENPATSHLDFVLTNVDLELDGVKIIKDGKFTPEAGMVEEDEAS